jgi:hypothetical protein
MGTQGAHATHRGTAECWCLCAGIDPRDAALKIDPRDAALKIDPRDAALKVNPRNAALIFLALMRITLR